MRLTRRVGIAALVVLAVATAAPTAVAQEPRTAVARMLTADGARAGRVQILSLAQLLAEGGEGGEFEEEAALTGRLTAQPDEIAIVLADLRGLPPGFHGFHIHETGSCAPPSFTSAGGHLDPVGASHPGHAGDMPVLYVNADGTAIAAFFTDRFRVRRLFDADGSAIVVHADADNHANIPTDRYDPDPDETTLATGDAGDRIACGVVSRRRPFDPFAQEPRVRATAVLRRSDGSPSGEVVLAPFAGKTLVFAFLESIRPGFHGFHVHETGRCRTPSFESAGGHFNPTGAVHPGHAGDLPVAYVMRERVGLTLFTTDRFRIRDLFDPDGSAFVVHTQPDNYANIPPDRYEPDPDEITLATGDAGARVACGVVRRLVRCTIDVSPRRVRAGERTILRARVRSEGRPLRGVDVLARGPGFATGRATNARGIARIPIHPRRPGRVRVRVLPDLGVLGCSRTVRILPARGGIGPALAGRVA